MIIAIFISFLSFLKSSTKFLSVKTVSDKVVTHSLAYPLHAKMIGVGRPLLRENVADTHPSLCKMPIFSLFSLVVPQL